VFIQLIFATAVAAAATLHRCAIKNISSDKKKMLQRERKMQAATKVNNSINLCKM
jgi:hypothetical protein